jgi:hypothetical protein
VSGDSFTIGTNGVGSCLNINKEGWVDVPFYITTQEVMVDTLRARTTEFINIDDNVVITGSLTVNGYVDAGAMVDHNPFWLAGKVAANGTRLSTRGRNQFTISKTGNGAYVINPTNANFSDTNYIINVTCQVDNGHAHARVGSSSVGLSSFLVATYVNNSLADCIFHFSVIY